MRAEIVTAWSDNTHAHIAMAVQEDDGRIEYNASLLLADLDGLTDEQRTNALIEAAKARRTLLRNEKTDLGLTGKGVSL